LNSRRLFSCLPASGDRYSNCPLDAPFSFPPEPSPNPFSRCQFLPIIPNKDLFRNPAYCAAAKPDAKLTIGCKIVLTLCLSCRNILGYRVMPHNQLGWLFQFGPLVHTFARENRSRRNLHGNEEESQKEKTLTVERGRYLAFHHEFHWPLRRSTSREAFPFRGKQYQNRQTPRRKSNDNLDSCVTMNQA
jgi:hypothetical protein